MHFPVSVVADGWHWAEGLPVTSWGDGWHWASTLTHLSQRPGDNGWHWLRAYPSLLNGMDGTG